MLHGCTVGDHSVIGIGAVVLNNAIIGKHCIVGANAPILENQIIPDRSLVVGATGAAGIKSIPAEDPYTEFQEEYATLKRTNEKIAALYAYKMQNPGSPYIREINEMLKSLQPVPTSAACPLTAVEMNSKPALQMGSQHD